MGKRNPETTKKPHLTVSEDLHRELRLLAAEENITLLQLAEELLRLGLDARKPQKKEKPQ